MVSSIDLQDPHTRGIYEDRQHLVVGLLSRVDVRIFAGSVRLAYSPATGYPSETLRPARWIVNTDVQISSVHAASTGRRDAVGRRYSTVRAARGRETRTSCRLAQHPLHARTPSSLLHIHGSPVRCRELPPLRTQEILHLGALFTFLRACHIPIDPTRPYGPETLRRGRAPYHKQ
jgi:hypothetical protein